MKGGGGDDPSSIDVFVDVVVSLRRDEEEDMDVEVEFVDSRRVGSWEAWMLRFVPSTVKVGFVLGDEITRPVGGPLQDKKHGVSEQKRRKGRLEVLTEMSSKGRTGRSPTFPSCPPSKGIALLVSDRKTRSISSTSLRACCVCSRSGSLCWTPGPCPPTSAALFSSPPFLLLRRSLT